jgi:hypothetical protein
MQAYNYVTNVVNTALQGKEHFQNISNEVTSYFTNLSNAIKGKETFMNNGTQVNATVGIAAFLFYVLIGVAFYCLYAYGAARLSYCYNIYNGSDAMTATMWSLLAFLFSGWYYPIYGVFLNPVCGIGPKQIGGRRR